MTDAKESCLPGSLSDLRRDERWRDGRLATVRARGGEWPAVTGELSLGGMRLGVHGLELATDEPVEVEVAFENATVSFNGTVRHVTTTAWGSIAGIEFEENAHSYLARRALSRQS